MTCGLSKLWVPCAGQEYEPNILEVDGASLVLRVSQISPSTAANKITLLEKSHFDKYVPMMINFGSSDPGNDAKCLCGRRSATLDAGVAGILEDLERRF